MISHPLPAGWVLRNGYLSNPHVTQERYVLDEKKRVDRAKVALTLRNYGHETFADAWELGADLFGLLRRARAYVPENGTLGDGGFVPNPDDPATKLAREIDAVLQQEDAS